MRRRPRRSASRPPSSSAPPKTMAYAVITHWRLCCEKPRSVPISGRATLTIATSRMTMNCATTTSARMAQRLELIDERVTNCLPESLIQSTIIYNNDWVGYTYSHDNDTNDTPRRNAHQGASGQPAARALAQPDVSAQAPHVGDEGAEARGLRADRPEPDALRGSRSPRRGGPRDAGDDRRRARLRPRLPRRTAGRALGSRADRTAP